MSGLVITICFYIITTSYIFLEGIHSTLTNWGQTQELNIYLKNEPTVKEAERIEEVLNKYKNNIDFEYIDNKKMLFQLKKQMPAISQEIEKNNEVINLLPTLYVVNADNKMFDNKFITIFNDIIEKLKPDPIILDISYGQVWLKKYTQFLLSIKSATVLLYLGLSLSLILVIGNSIRSTIQAKREEIEILKLVGATKAMINKPFLIEGTLTSFICICIALGLTSLTTICIQTYLTGDNQLIGLRNTINNFEFLEVLIFTTSACILGYGGSYWVLKNE